MNTNDVQKIFIMTINFKRKDKILLPHLQLSVRLYPTMHINSALWSLY